MVATDILVVMVMIIIVFMVIKVIMVIIVIIVFNVIMGEMVVMVMIIIVIMVFNVPGQTVNCCSLHPIHILKAIVPAVNLAYLGTLYVHPVTRPIFCNILGINWQYWLKPCHMHIRIDDDQQENQQLQNNDKQLCFMRERDGYIAWIRE